MSFGKSNPAGSAWNIVGFGSPDQPPLNESSCFPGKPPDRGRQKMGNSMSCGGPPVDRVYPTQLVGQTKKRWFGTQVLPRICRSDGAYRNSCCASYKDVAPSEHSLGPAKRSQDQMDFALHSKSRLPPRPVAVCVSRRELLMISPDKLFG